MKNDEFEIKTDINRPNSDLIQESSSKKNKDKGNQKESEMLITNINNDEMPKQTEKSTSSPKKNEIESTPVLSYDISLKYKQKNEKKESDNKLVFTFKNNKEIDQKTGDLRKSQEYSYILETENNLRLFEKKYEEFQRNSVRNSSVIKDSSPYLSKFEEPLRTSVEIDVDNYL
jgi:hypothetical protein